MRFLTLCVVIALFCCSRGFCLAEETDANQTRKAGKPLPSGIKTLALITDSKTLLALTADDLFVLDPSTLSPSNAITIKAKDGRDLSSYWRADNAVISADQEHVLVFDKYVDLATGKSKVTLDVVAAVKKGKPNPTALDISPTGKLGLVLVYSFHAGKHNALALFDLKTGKLIHARETGEKVANAVFVSETELMLFYVDGRITIEDIKGQTSASLTKNGPIPRPGRNSISVIGSAKDRTIIAIGQNKDGASQILAISPITRKMLFKDKCDGSVFTQVNSEWVLYQTTRTSKILCPCGQHPLIDIFLKAKNIKTGVVIEHKVHKMFDMMVFDSKQNSFLCVDHDTVTSMKLPAAFMKKIYKGKKVEQENAPDKK